MQKLLGRGQAVKALGFDPSIPRFESWRPSHLMILEGARMRISGLTKSSGMILNSATSGAGPEGVGQEVRSNPGAPAINHNDFEGAHG